MDYTGSIAGTCDNCIISNIIVQNTFVNAPSRLIIGGLFGRINGGTVTNCHNIGFPSNQSMTIVNGGARVGGFAGDIINAIKIGSGVSNGMVLNNGNCAGGLAGLAQDSNFTSCYTKSSVSIQSAGISGGLFGDYNCASPNNMINNTYSRAKVLGNNVGGLVGHMDVGAGSSIAFLNTYSSNTLLGSSVGASFGRIALQNGGNCTFNKVYFDNFTDIYVPIGSGNTSCSDGTVPFGLACGDLYSQILAFDQTNVWNGDNLLSEFPVSYGFCNCSNACPTAAPSTMIPSTLVPSTTIPSTSTPSTTSPSSLIPSTLIPSTLVPSTTIPSTSTPSTTPPSTSVPSNPPNCLYNVPNCQNCGLGSGFIVDTTQFNVSCVLSNSNWIYSFSDKFSNTTTVKESFTLNSTSLIILGDFDLSQNTTIDIVFSDSNKNGAINVTGCITLNGNISLTLEKRPERGTTKIVLINYNTNCSLPINFKRDVQTIQTSKFSVKPTYVNNKCDKISSTLNNQQGTLSLSLSASLNGNCSGISTGAIIGIVLGVVEGSLIVVILGLIFFWKRRQNLENAISMTNMEEK
eukprot:TRINITY_DN3685_c0_g2_i4.p1 TRINITY_DN3685_c0_g2~~TRINITY_DN3685_c0_g2_i4.p1  ORF type:complete len:574 (+),score=115.42 TRINITY_DN3685_c0_g2_i4:459-2180(+)